MFPPPSFFVLCETGEGMQSTFGGTTAAAATSREKKPSSSFESGEARPSSAPSSGKSSFSGEFWREKWNGAVGGILGKALAYTRKTKHITHGWSLAAVALCCTDIFTLPTTFSSDAAIFPKYAQAIFENLFKIVRETIKEKDKDRGKRIPMVVSAIQKLMDSTIARQLCGLVSGGGDGGGGSESRYMLELLQSVTSNVILVLSSVKSIQKRLVSTLIFENQEREAIAELIVDISCHHLDFAIFNILTELMREEACPDYLAIGLCCIYKLVIEESNSSESSLLSQQVSIPVSGNTKLFSNRSSTTSAEAHPLPKREKYFDSTNSNNNNNNSSSSTSNETKLEASFMWAGNLMARRTGFIKTQIKDGRKNLVGSGKQRQEHQQSISTAESRRSELLQSGVIVGPSMDGMVFDKNSTGWGLVHGAATPVPSQMVFSPLPTTAPAPNASSLSTPMMPFSSALGSPLAAPPPPPPHLFSVSSPLVSSPYTSSVVSTSGNMLTPPPPSSPSLNLQQHDGMTFSGVAASSTFLPSSSSFLANNNTISTVGNCQQDYASSIASNPGIRTLFSQTLLTCQNAVGGYLLTRFNALLLAASVGDSNGAVSNKEKVKSNSTDQPLAGGGGGGDIAFTATTTTNAASANSTPTKSKISRSEESSRSGEFFNPSSSSSNNNNNNANSALGGGNNSLLSPQNESQMVPKDKVAFVKVLALALRCIPAVTPSEISHRTLASIVSSLTLHAAAEIRTEAEATLVRIFECGNPVMQPLLIYYFSLLTASVVDTNLPVHAHTLSHLFLLVNRWTILLKSDAAEKNRRKNLRGEYSADLGGYEIDVERRGEERYRSAKDNNSNNKNDSKPDRVFSQQVGGGNKPSSSSSKGVIDEGDLMTIPLLCHSRKYRSRWNLDVVCRSIEPVGLSALASSNPQIRLLGLQVLHAAREVLEAMSSFRESSLSSASTREGSMNMPPHFGFSGGEANLFAAKDNLVDDRFLLSSHPIAVLDILEQGLDDALRRCYFNSWQISTRMGEDILFAPLQNVNVYSLVSRSSPSDQLRWTRIYVELLKLVRSLRPECGAEAWGLFVLRSGFLKEKIPLVSSSVSQTFNGGSSSSAVNNSNNNNAAGANSTSSSNLNSSNVGASGVGGGGGMTPTMNQPTPSSGGGKSEKTSSRMAAAAAAASPLASSLASSRTSSERTGISSIAEKDPKNQVTIGSSSFQGGLAGGFGTASDSLITTFRNFIACAAALAPGITTELNIFYFSFYNDYCCGSEDSFSHGKQAYHKVVTESIFRLLSESNHQTSNLGHNVISNAASSTPLSGAPLRSTLNRRLGVDGKDIASADTNSQLLLLFLNSFMRVPSPLEFAKSIVSLLLSQRDSHRIAAQIALGRVNSDLYELISILLGGMESELYMNGRSQAVSGGGGGGGGGPGYASVAPGAKSSRDFPTTIGLSSGGGGGIGGIGIPAAGMNSNSGGGGGSGVGSGNNAIPPSISLLSKREQDMLRLQIGNIYRHICEVTPPSMLSCFPILRYRLLLFLYESVSFLQSPSNDSPYELRPLRFSLAVITRAVAHILADSTGSATVTATAYSALNSGSSLGGKASSSSSSSGGGGGGAGGEAASKGIASNKPTHSGSSLAHLLANIGTFPCRSLPPFPALRNLLFQLLSSWCGIGHASINQEREDEKTCEEILKKLPSVSASAMMESMQTLARATKAASLMAMASLLEGPIWEVSFEGNVFQWIDACLEHAEKSVRRIGMVALKNFLHFNPRTVSTAISVSIGAQSPRIAKAYTLAVSFVICLNKEVVKIPETLTLVLIMAASPSLKVRSAAMDVLHSLLLRVKVGGQSNSSSRRTSNSGGGGSAGRSGEGFEGSKGVSSRHLSLPSLLSATTMETFGFQQLELSRSLAKDCRELTLSVVDEMMTALLRRGHASTTQRQLLNCLCPWLENLQLNSELPKVREVILEQLVALTKMYGEQYQEALTSMWMSVSYFSSNVETCILYVVNAGCLALQRKSDLSSLKRVIYYLSLVTPETVVNQLVKIVNPSTHKDWVQDTTTMSRHAAANSSSSNNVRSSNRQEQQQLLAARSSSSSSFHHRARYSNSNSNNSNNALGEVEELSSSSSAGVDNRYRGRNVVADGNNGTAAAATDAGVLTTASAGDDAEASKGKKSKEGKGGILGSALRNLRAGAEKRLHRRSKGRIDESNANDAKVMDDIAFFRQQEQEKRRQQQQLQEQQLRPSSFDARQPQSSVEEEEQQAARRVENSSIGEKLRSREFAAGNVVAANNRSSTNNNNNNNDNVDNSNNNPSEIRMRKSTSSSALRIRHRLREFLNEDASEALIFPVDAIVVLLVEAITVKSVDDLWDFLPSLFHIAFITLNRPSTIVSDHARLLAVSLIRNLSIRTARRYDASDLQVEMCEYTINEFSEFLSQILQKAENPSLMRPNPPTTKIVSDAVERVLDICCDSDREFLRQTWGRLSLEWAAITPIRIWAHRSLLVLRGLCPHFSPNEVLFLLQSLGDALAEPNVQGVCFGVDVLQTLENVVKSYRSDYLLLLPQVFWCTVAILKTPFIPLFHASLKLLLPLLKGLDWCELYVRNVLLATIPKQWKDFKGLQPLLLRGLTSDATLGVTLQVLTVAIEYDIRSQVAQLFHSSKSSFPQTILALLPIFLAHCKQSEKVSELANLVASLCELKGHSNLSVILIAFSQGKFGFEGGQEEMLRMLANPLLSLVSHPLLSSSLKLLASFLERPAFALRRCALSLMNLLLRTHIQSAASSASIITEKLMGKLTSLMLAFSQGPLWKESLEMLGTLAIVSGSPFFSSTSPQIEVQKSGASSRRRSVVVFDANPAEGTTNALSSFLQVLEHCPIGDMMHERAVAGSYFWQPPTSSQLEEQFFQDDLLLDKGMNPQSPPSNSEAMGRGGGGISSINSLLAHYEVLDWADENEYLEQPSAFLDEEERNIGPFNRASDIFVDSSLQFCDGDLLLAPDRD